MKKAVTLLIVVIALTSWTFSEKFTSFTLSNKYVCLPYEQMDKLIISHKLVKTMEAEKIILKNQIKLIETERNTYKKKQIKVFIFGVCAGVGISLIGAVAIIINQIF
jgi:hypothetical protein